MTSSQPFHLGAGRNRPRLVDAQAQGISYPLSTSAGKVLFEQPSSVVCVHADEQLSFQIPGQSALNVYLSSSGKNLAVLHRMKFAIRPLPISRSTSPHDQTLHCWSEEHSLFTADFKRFNSSKKSVPL